ncbi:MAG: HPF/RaiA family ribosome-associated protein [Xenococcaceae cyanobacterium MO_234.B1]|nr:HPF/RaiA family ribosome-associated protein [Xenococcaceae cyanobacterium MO_234.B1]
MQIPLQITFHDLPPSDAIEAQIRQKVEKLNRFYDRIISCRVVVEAPHRHHHQGNIYHVRIDLTVPQGEVVINRNPSQNHAHEDLYVAIRDAFAAAQRRLKSYAAVQRQKTKVHEIPDHGRVISLLPEEGYGFIETSEGDEVYFHQNSLLNCTLRDLQVGSEVRLIEQMGDKGLQASSVRLIGKHHLHG